MAVVDLPRRDGRGSRSLDNRRATRQNARPSRNGVSLRAAPLCVQRSQRTCRRHSDAARCTNNKCRQRQPDSHRRRRRGSDTRQAERRPKAGRYTGAVLATGPSLRLDPAASARRGVRNDRRWRQQVLPTGPAQPEKRDGSRSLPRRHQDAPMADDPSPLQLTKNVISTRDDPAIPARNHVFGEFNRRWLLGDAARDKRA